MQHTALPRSDTARRTGDSKQFFRRQFAHPHLDTLRQNQPQICPILDIMRAKMVSDIASLVRNLPDPALYSEHSTLLSTSAFPPRRR
jgi:hypothetical protein